LKTQKLKHRKIPILGKHTRRITTGAWSKDGLLALGGEDRTLTISNEYGDTMRQTGLKDLPSQIMFSDRKQDVRSQLNESTVSLLLNKKTMFFFNFDDPDNPIELAFQQKYGDIVNYQWYGDGYIMVGFTNGYLIVVSTHAKEIGTVCDLLSYISA
jgi:WD repeat-containing protein 19